MRQKEMAVLDSLLAIHDNKAIILWIKLLASPHQQRQLSQARE